MGHAEKIISKMHSVFVNIFCDVDEMLITSGMGFFRASFVVRLKFDEGVWALV